MEIILFLTGLPLISAILLLVIPFKAFRKAVVWISCLVICAASVYLLVHFFKSNTVFFTLDNEWISRGMYIIELLIALFIVFVSIKNRKFLTTLFVVLQFGLMTVFEVMYGARVISQRSVFVDQLSIIMALIIGIIGSLICVYSLGYMKDYHEHHHDIKNRSNLFFFILFVFLSAMFGLVFSNNLLWLFFFWEITTLSSFLLIGYSGSEEAVNNAFLALVINLAGGLAFAGAIFYLYSANGIIELDKLLGTKNSLVLIPVALMCFAGITKSAQMPFSKWLLGAMVAPTPTSALLHSSTMVKAGVYLLIRLSPLLSGTVVGHMVAIIGGLTFLIAAFIAVSQRNAKRVLAYSTISNLGLIVACAGVGTYQTVWAGIFLIIFHAIAKSLLFISVGTVEHRLGSRDIEDMDNLLVKMPRLTIMMIIGICGMFIAPFGMLISKWAAIEAFININPVISPILIIFIAYGSSVTVFFWTKWLGKLISVYKPGKKLKNYESEISISEWFSEGVHSVLTVAACVLFPFISTLLVEPFLKEIYGQSAGLDRSNFIIMAVMVVMIIVIPALLIFIQHNKKGYIYGDAYMSGRNKTPDNNSYEGSIGSVNEVTIKNYYLENIFGEKRLMTIGIIICSVAVVIMLGVSLI